jgi:hypothetical protein
MPPSELRLIKRFAEFVPQERTLSVPKGIRGIYALYRRRRTGGKYKFDVVYVGMAAAGRRGGLRSRLNSHRKRKGHLWTHFSAFQAWDNIRDEEIKELEGLFRHLYRKDTKANRLNIHRGFKKMRGIRQNDLSLWSEPVPAPPSARYGRPNMTLQRTRSPRSARRKPSTRRR